MIPARAKGEAMRGDLVVKRCAKTRLFGGIERGEDGCAVDYGSYGEDALSRAG